MDKQFHKFLLIVVVAMLAIPLIVNFGILYINFIPSAGGNNDMLNFYGGYLGGCVGGLATLITIYYAVLHEKKTHEPLLYFNDKQIFYYIPKGGGIGFFSMEQIEDDNNISMKINPCITFDVDNISQFPALDLKWSIIHLNDFLKSVKYLEPNSKILNEINKTFSRKDMKLETKSILKAGSTTKIYDTGTFEHLLNILTYVYEITNETKKNTYNLAFKHEFKLYDILVECKDIDNIIHKGDTFTVCVQIDKTLPCTLKIAKYEEWTITIKFIKNNR